MRNLILLSVISLSILFFTKSYAQNKYSETFGKVTQYEMSMTEYENDKEAEALVIYDLGNNSFRTDYDKGFLLSKKRSFKIKILNQAGLDYANIEIPFYVEGGQGTEEVRDIEAYTYNWENNSLSKTKLDDKKIYEEKVNEKWYVKKFAMPDVREGSVIEIKYEIVTPFYFNMGEWAFQKKIPVVHSSLVYLAIPYYEYTYLAMGLVKFDEFSSDIKSDEIRFGNLLYKEIEYKFGMNNIPAFRDEEFITSPKNHMKSINFQLSKIYYPNGGNRQIMTTWPQMAKDFMKNDYFGKYIKNSKKESKKVLPEINLENKTQLEQVKTIVSYIKNMYNWNGFNDKYAVLSVSDFMRQKTGNSANINLFLIGLLQGANIDAAPVIISTRNHTAISKDHPFTHFFNYVIAEITMDNDKYYVDATESLLDFDELPERCIHVEGLAIKNDGKMTDWVITQQNYPSITEKKLKITLIPEQTKAEVNAEYIASGYAAYNYRSIHLGKNENLVQHLQKKNNLIPKGDIHVSDETLSNPFSFSFSFDTNIETTPDKLYVKPFCGLSINDNPFKQNNRTLPVDLLYFRGESYSTIIDIPEGYRVEYLPRTSNVNNKILTLNYTAKEENNKIIVIANYTLKKNIYDASEYIMLKSVFTSMIQRFSDMIILTRIQE